MRRAKAALRVYSAEGGATFSKDVRAYDLVFVLFDTWGERMQNLRSNEVKDLPATGEIRLEGNWNATENAVSEFHTSVAFVDRVMLADGSIWRADRASITKKLAEVQIQVAESGLAKDPPKEAAK